MRENVYAAVLRQLVANEASTQAVASLLHVPESTQRALQLVTENESPGQAPADPLIFKAGPVVAECLKCGHGAFRPADPAAPFTYRSVLACAACGAAIVRRDLVEGLAREVAKRAGTYVTRARLRLRG